MKLRTASYSRSWQKRSLLHGLRRLPCHGKLPELQIFVTPPAGSGAASATVPELQIFVTLYQGMDVPGDSPTRRHMKYIAADGTGSPFDLQRNFGDVLIKSGLVKEYVSPVQSKKADTAWGVARFADGRPYVSGFCRTCGGKYNSAALDLERLTPFLHCGVQEAVPADVVNQYQKAVVAFTPKAPVERKPEKIFLNI